MKGKTHAEKYGIYVNRLGLNKWIPILIHVEK